MVKELPHRIVWKLAFGLQTVSVTFHARDETVPTFPEAPKVPVNHPLRVCLGYHLPYHDSFGASHWCGTEQGPNCQAYAGRSQLTLQLAERS